MNENFHPYKNFSIVYNDDILVFSQSLDEHWKHLKTFKWIIKKNGLVLSQRKIKLFEIEIQFLRYKVTNKTITPVERVIKFADKFSDEITDKK